MKINILVPIEYTETVTYPNDNGEMVTEEVTKVRYEAQNVEMTPEEEAEILAQQNSPQAKLEQIEQLKAELASTDYKAIKKSEGLISEEEYAPIKAERQAIREQIRELEGRV